MLLLAQCSLWPSSHLGLAGQKALTQIWENPLEEQGLLLAVCSSIPDDCSPPCSPHIRSNQDRMSSEAHLYPIATVESSESLGPPGWSPWSWGRREGILGLLKCPSWTRPDGPLLLKHLALRWSQPISITKALHSLPFQEIPWWWLSGHTGSC